MSIQHSHENPRCFPIGFCFVRPTEPTQIPDPPRPDNLDVIHHNNLDIEESSIYTGTLPSLDEERMQEGHQTAERG